jgi:hypothetical protein
MLIHSMIADHRGSDMTHQDDANFLKSLQFAKGSDPSLRKAAADGNVARFCKAWLQVHASRKTSRNKSEKTNRIEWSVPSYPEEIGLARILEQASAQSPKRTPNDRRTANKLAPKKNRYSQIVAELIDCLRSDESRPFVLLAAMEILDQVGSLLETKDLFTLWQSTLIRISNWTKPDSTDPTIPADILAIEVGEIPFVGGMLFCDIDGMAKLARAGGKCLAKELLDRTDTDGTPHAELISRLPLWLAPLIRASLLAERTSTPLWNEEQRQRLANVVDRAVGLCRPDGRAALADSLGRFALPILISASELLGNNLVESANNYIRNVHSSVNGKPVRKSRLQVVSMPSNQSDWARFALMRSDWNVDADSIAITHHQSIPQLDITALGKSLIQGDWNVHLKIGDSPVELAEEWSCVCWQSDPDADYIELQMQGPGKLCVERMMMLSRKEHFLVLADSISGVPKPPRRKKTAGLDANNGVAESTDHSSEHGRSQIQFESRLTLADGLSATFEGTTREVRVAGNRVKARIFPLGIPQDRVNSTPHELSIQQNQIVLKQIGEGEGLFAPLVIDWHPDRNRAEAVWRMLTVTENGHVVGPDVAVGYRLKLAQFQLFVSRRLKKSEYAPACLGHHSHNETVIGTVDSKGDIEPILLVE